MLVQIGHRLGLLSGILLTGLLVLMPRLAYADASLLKTADKQILVKKYKNAARTLTKAMNSGDLSDKQMAQALYRRGVANNGTGRYSSAISDLTGALWLGKLESKARNEAHRQRGLAYEAVGFKKLASRDFSKSGLRSATANSRRKKPSVRTVSAPISSFDTVVRAVKNPTPPTRAKIEKKPVVAQKSAIPAFRTSIVTE